MFLNFYGSMILITWLALLFDMHQLYGCPARLYNSLEAKFEKQNESHPSFVKVHSFNYNYRTVLRNKVLF